MDYAPKTYHSKLFRDFKAIEITAHHTITRFFEDKEAQIRQLEFNEYFELLVAYTDALFEIGAYSKHLLMADVVIETTILQNIQFFNGQDVYLRMLFRKAASLFNLHEYEKSDYILRELIKINPYQEDFILFLKKCLRKTKPSYIQPVRAITIFLLFAAALVILVEVLFVRTFYAMHTDLVEQSRNSIFIFAVLILVGGNAYHWYQVNQEVDAFVAQKQRDFQEKAA